MMAICLLVGGPTLLIDGFHFEWSDRFGPATVNRRTGAIHDNQPGPRSPFWKAVALWNEQGRRVNAAGKCLYDAPLEPQYVQLAGRHYVEVPPGRTPGDVRDEWRKKLKKVTP